jgi:drug/metabolite transporter (DMT)-like permease
MPGSSIHFPMHMAASPPAAARPDQATILAFGAIVLLGSLNAITVKLSVRELAPFWSAGGRFVIAGLLLSGMVLLARRQIPRGLSLGGAVIYGLMGFAATFGFVYPALRDVPASTGMLFLALVPLLTFGLAVLQRQETFHLRALLGALVALAGVGVVVADQLTAEIPLGSIVLMLAGTVTLAESSVILKWVPRSDPISTNAVAMSVGGLALLALSLVAGERWLVPAQAETWLAMAYLVVFGSIILFGLYLFALHRWAASAVSYVTLLMPLVTTPIAAVVFNERISPSLAVGGALALVGVYVGAFHRARSKDPPPTSLAECLPMGRSAASASD